MSLSEFSDVDRSATDPPGPGTDDALAVVAVDDIVTVTQEVWSALLDLDIHPISDTAMPSPSITGCVQITGEWDGAVLLTCSTQFARTATEAMFATDDVTQDDIVDAVGELTNMVGGNIKSLLPGPSSLSVPSVATGERYEVHIPGATPLHELVLGCGADPVAVSVWGASGSST